MPPELRRQSPPSPGALRAEAFGESHALTPVDRFGIWLSRRQVRRWVPTMAGKTIGDFGCGYQARLARSYLQEIEKVYLADVSLAADLRSDAKAVCLQGPLPGTLRSIPEASLDVALCISVLEHLDEPDEMLRQLFRVLKPGGVALLNVPSWRGKYFLELSAFRLGLSPAAEMDDHRTYYDVRDLWPHLVAAGFRPSRIKCFGHKFGLNTFAFCRKGDA
jgi:SAM-dependent methyltransferase